MAKLYLSRPNEKQVAFFNARARYIAYGGARGGGKSWAARVKAVLLALRYPGVQILLLRRTYKELEANHVLPLRQMLQNIAKYNDSKKVFTFQGGSRIVLGYCADEGDVLQYQGQSYDVIFLEEATQFTEFQFQAFTECNRLSGQCTKKITPRMYFTCNPGGVGHSWVKRLFIDRLYKNGEREEDYVFIPARVYDNRFLMENDPDYVKTLENLPPDRKRAMLYGDWDVFEGQYFSEFDRGVHTVEPFEIPKDWRRYFTMDYGLDMLAGYWIAVDGQRRAYVYREIYESGLIISRAIEEIQKRTAEEIYQYIAPPDLWNRRQDTGKSVAELFGERGIYLTKAQNDRVMGWYNLKEWLKTGIDERGEKTAGLQIFRSCRNLIRCLPQLTFDSKNPNDVSKTPHELTHGPDALRYFAAGRPSPALLSAEKKNILPFALRTAREEGDEEEIVEW